VVLTFDDGFGSVHGQALPLLEGLGFTATVFPIVSGLGRRIEWRVGGRPLPPLQLMGVSELQELVAAGWEVGGHTLDHRYLPELERERVIEQVAGGRDALEYLLGLEVRTFAYPFGGSSPEVRELVADAGFGTAWSTRPGRLDLAHPHLLRRFMLPPRSTPHTFRAALGPGPALAHSTLAGLAALRGRPPQYAAYAQGTWCSTFAPQAQPDGPVRLRS
jgi:peptidoglycan/xylan/chitin deacetylase (PgdA/CDA1 family)